MGESKRDMPKNSCSFSVVEGKDQWVIKGGEDDHDTYHDSSSSEDSTVSNGSSSTSDMADDASSPSTSNSSSPHSAGSLYDLSELMAELPIKRGLSKFYQGKSQSYASLSRVTSVEDLPKKETPYKKKMMASKSYGGGLDKYKSHTLPKPTISKKASKGPLSSLSRRGSFVSSCRAPLIPVHEHLGTVEDLRE